jgi:nucleoside 2-deoxyribosyltransferase
VKERVYIASPYTNGWHAANVRRQLDAKNILLKQGFVPFAPLIGHYFEMVHPQGEKIMLEWDLEWLKVCHVLIRIHVFDKDGIEVPSPGADIEEQTAIENNIPVYHFLSIEHLERDFKRLREEDLKRAA